MLHKLLFSSLITFLLLEINNPLEAQAKQNISSNGLIHKFCVASIKSNINSKNKQNLNEISNFTCECFLKKYRSGNSLKKSRIYCKNKATEKYNL
tara:strand:- start:159 stop:443 length:285 start_codon:yes stop_codon:yes gene_type:complete